MTAPAGTAERLAVEKAVRERGWPMALSPAEANILIVAGADLESIRLAVESVWAAMPHPRARADLRHANDVAAMLDAAVSQLAGDTPDAPRTTPPAAEPLYTGHHERALLGGGHEHRGPRGTTSDNGHAVGHGESGHDMHSEHAGDEHGGDEHGGDEHGGHHGHNMAGMQMPGGIAMAERALDRDGLKLDVLNVPLGPATPLWPTGLLVTATMQGDVITAVDVATLSAAAGDGPFWSHLADQIGPERATSAWRLDSCSRLLALTGWDDTAITARRLRDDILAGPVGLATRRQVRAWSARVRRSRMLRWSLSGLGPVPGDEHLAEEYTGDAYDRLLRWVHGIETAALGGPAGLESPVWTQWLLDALPGLLVGAEVAQARLIVASFDPYLALVAQPGHHGEEAHRD
ncbi:hypothetical protein FOS14_22240 [Skermania sp. ID1734]|uniref:hypothetical protein n=1 Tax=Skermania sp. ID1734 TaxID=2597516 RepID=UPI00117E6BFB|nr:hypothetical protein [Skermania sp. ID1734]TSD93780.1 hypothetical protein FOS14_22240 [Skermania sp. ID1734]